MTSQSVSGHDASESVHSPRDAQYIAVEEGQVVLPVHAAGAALSDQSRTAVRKLVLVTVIALVFMMMEFIGGYIAGSLAVISDAVHMLTDVLGFAIALTAIWVGKRPPSDKLSFGFHRVEVVGALVSIMVIWILTGVLVYSAVLRTRDFLKDDAEQVVDGKTMFIIAFIGLAMNVVMMQVLGNDGHGHSHGISVGHSHSHGHGHSHGVDEEDKHAHGRHSHSHGDGGSDEHDHDHNHDLSDNHSAHGDHSDDHGETNPCGDHGEIDAATSQKKMKKKGGLFASKFENLNIQAAYLHVLGDLLQSVGVTIAGAIIWWKPSWQLADPIMTFVFSLLVVGTTTGTVRESILILMEATPRKFQYAEVEMGLKSCREVLAVHDLHIWSLSTNRPALAVHLVSDHPEESLVSAQQYLIAEGITHTTIQIERRSASYPQQCADEGRCQ